MFITAPDDAFSSGRNARVVRNMLVRLVARMAFQVSSDARSMGSRSLVPATFSSATSRPKSSVTLAARASTSSSLVTSATEVRCCAPLVPFAPTVVVAASSSPTSASMSFWMSTASTVAPSSARLRQQARPMPDAPPVTSTGAPSNVNFSSTVISFALAAGSSAPCGPNDGLVGVVPLLAFVTVTPGVQHDHLVVAGAAEGVGVHRCATQLAHQLLGVIDQVLQEQQRVRGVCHVTVDADAIGGGDHRLDGRLPGDWRTLVHELLGPVHVGGRRDAELACREQLVLGRVPVYGEGALACFLEQREGLLLAHALVLEVDDQLHEPGGVRDLHREVLCLQGLLPGGGRGLHKIGVPGRREDVEVVHRP